MYTKIYLYYALRAERRYVRDMSSSSSSPGFISLVSYQLLYCIQIDTLLGLAGLSIPSTARLSIDLTADGKNIGVEIEGGVILWIDIDLYVKTKNQMYQIVSACISNCQPLNTVSRPVARSYSVTGTTMTSTSINGSNDNVIVLYDEINGQPDVLYLWKCRIMNGGWRSAACWHYPGAGQGRGQAWNLLDQNRQITKKAITSGGLAWTWTSLYHMCFVLEAVDIRGICVESSGISLCTMDGDRTVVHRINRKQVCYYNARYYDRVMVGTHS